MKVVNDLFIDLSTIPDQAVGRFVNHLDGLTSNWLNICKGVTQNSVLGPLLFSVYINCLGQNLDGVKLHFYADDTLIYCAGSCITKAGAKLQAVFNIIQIQLSQRQLDEAHTSSLQTAS